jgi:hypothetical protein
MKPESRRLIAEAMAKRWAAKTQAERSAMARKMAIARGVKERARRATIEQLQAELMRLKTEKRAEP